MNDRTAVPAISVVMPTHNRGALLRRTLDALASQTVHSDTFELILVADGCTDETPRIVEDAHTPYRITLIEQPGQGAATARNNGAAAARAPIIVFLDDDMEAGQNLIAAHLRAHARRPGGIVLGYFPIPADEARDDPFASFVKQWWDNGFRRRARPDYRFSFTDFCTGNISLPADLFHDVGGFYQQIGSAGGEDYELGFRLLKRGIRFQFEPDALSIHHDTTTLPRAIRRQRVEGLAYSQVVQRHPELFWSFRVHKLSRLQNYPLLWRAIWRWPWPAHMVALTAARLVPIARYLNLQSTMWRLFNLAASYHYWRGAMDAFKTPDRLWRLEQDAPYLPDPDREVDIDIACDWAELDSYLESAHADSARLYCNGEPIGRIYPVVGAERLSGPCVRAEVIERFPGILLGLMTDKFLQNRHSVSCEEEADLNLSIAGLNAKARELISGVADASSGR